MLIKPYAANIFSAVGSFTHWSHVISGFYGIQWSDLFAKQRTQLGMITDESIQDFPLVELLFRRIHVMNETVLAKNPFDF